MRRAFTSYLPSIALGTFLARFFYERDPLRLSFLGDWPGVIALSVVCLLVTHYSSLVTRHAPRITLIPLLLLFVYIFRPEVDLRWALVLLIGSLELVGQAVLLTYKPRWFDLALAASVLAVYLLTLGTRVGRADSFEFQVVMPQLGIAHPTGYPLFILIGKFFSLLPFGSMAFRVNLLSAVAATGAVMLIYHLIVRLTIDRLAAALAALTLAASSVFWSQAVVIEVYALNALFVAIILAMLIRLIGNGSTGNQSTGNRSTSYQSTDYRSPISQSTNLPIYLLALTFGLALSHHLTAVILIPPIMIALALTYWHRSRLLHRDAAAARNDARGGLPLKSWLMAIGLFVLGLTPWLYIPLRWPGLHNGAAMSMAEWLGWIFGQRFGGALNLSLWTDPTRWGIISRLALDQFGVIGAVLAAVGLLVLITRAWRVALITFVTFAGYWFYGLVYNVPDVNVFIIPAFLIMAVWLGFGVHWLAKLVESTNQRISEQANRRTSESANQRISELLVTRYSSLSHTTHHAARSTHYALLFLLPLSLIATNFAVVDQHERDSDLEEWGRYVLSLPIPANAAILADSEKIAPLYYLQVTEGLRPDLDILVLGDEAQYRQELDQRLSAGQAVYLARFLPNLPYRMRSLGPLVEVSGEPLKIVPVTDRTLNADFDQRIKLIGATGQLSESQRVTLIWQATSAERANYHVRLRLIDSAGQVWWEDQGAHPVGGYYPTGAWMQGEIVPDFHEINIEPFVPPGVYDLAVGLFVPFHDEALTVNGRKWLIARPIRVEPHAPDILAHEVRIVSGARVITSVGTLGDVPPASEAALRITATGPDSKAVLSIWADNAASVLSTTQLVRAGESRLMFGAPEANSVYTLRLSFDAPSRCGWLAPLTTDCPIGAVRVAGEAIGNASNFDNQVLLTTSQVDRTTLQPGETIKVDLTWRSLKTWSDNYTAFVHLVGPDGKVHGQVDQWPIQGTLPTSSWSAGQVVADPYAVTLPPDAPRGTYQVEVGWYLLATLRRLSVLDATGRPGDDKVIIGEFVVP
ncbi:MAG: DUF2723 domain-containing protein [Chloroflexi bacterium]|nr:DUF2723 domain-containing protein [Chloroflexota bacterium]